jgi:hypothetical protein
MDLIRHHRKLVALVRATLGDRKPAVVVLDTLNRSLVGSESKDEDMGAYLDAACAIRDTFACTVIVVHHCGIDGTRPRGHTSITGTCETQIAVKRDAAENVHVEVEYMKDGSAGAVETSRLEQVQVGIDDEGDQITSMIVRPALDESARARGAVHAKLPKGAKIALEALAEALHSAGEPAPPSGHIPTGTRVVRRDLWRQYSYRRGISDSPEEKSRQQAFRRAHETLAAARAIGIWDEWVWLA